MSIVLDGTNGIDSSDLNITGSAARISADFSNGTFANRTMFQSNVTNGVSVVSVIPNGTSDTASFRALNNSDPTNASYIQLLCDSSVAKFETSITGTGSYLPMTFHTGGGEKMRIDTSGNVGIGTTTPATVLNVYNATSASISVDGDSGTSFRASRYSSDASAANFVSRKARGTLASPTAVNSGDGVGQIIYTAYGGSNFRQVATIDGIVETYTSDTNISGTLIFRTNGGGTTVTERMRITDAGNVGIGTGSPTQPLDVNGNVAISGTGRRITGDFSNTTLANRLMFQTSVTNGNTFAGFIPNGSSTSAGFVCYANSDPTNTSTFSVAALSTESRLNSSITGSGTYLPMTFYTSGSERMRIASDGKVTFANVYATTVGATNRDLFIDSTGLIGYVSSVRESKLNIEDLSELSWLYKLNPVSFNYRKKDEDGNYTDEIDGDIQYGLIAEDVEEIRQDLCFYDETEDGQILRGIQYSKLVVPMLKAIQELKTELDSVKAELNTLKGN